MQTKTKARESRTISTEPSVMAEQPNDFFLEDPLRRKRPRDPQTEILTERPRKQTRLDDTALAIECNRLEETLDQCHRQLQDCRARAQQSEQQLFASEHVRIGQMQSLLASLEGVFMNIGFQDSHSTILELARIYQVPLP